MRAWLTAILFAVEVTAMLQAEPPKADLPKGSDFVGVGYGGRRLFSRD